MGTPYIGPPEIPMNKNPLSYLSEFNKLQTLKLAFVISTDIQNTYFDALWENPSRAIAKCLNLNTVHFEFACESNFDQFLAANDVAIKVTDTINKIWSYVLSLTPNLTNYSFAISEDFEPWIEYRRLNHLIGHYGQLQSLTIPNPTMLEYITSDIASLRKLEISMIGCMDYSFLNTSNFPNLESFEIVRKEKYLSICAIDSGNESVIGFFKYS